MEKESFEKFKKDDISSKEEAFEAPIVEKEKIKPIEIKKDKVIVMGVEVLRNLEAGPRTPHLDRFYNFVEDEFSLELLQKIAKGVALDQPIMLEGEAAIGKSYTIEYLAALTNQEVYRMSLNGQTDTTDLIGKWAPRSEGPRKKIQPLLDDPKRCRTKEAKAIIESKMIEVTPEAKKEAVERGRGMPVYIGFTREEMEEICRLEKIDVPESEWVWQNGELPRQIENGAWTVLDEVNTCEPQILVRLNSILEKGGQLVLHENGGIIPQPKDPSKKHMLFATGNPPGGKYRGRVPLSGELISRWNYQNIGELPKETAIFRAKRKNGCRVELKDEKIREKTVKPEAIGEELKLANIFGEEWTADFCEKYIAAFYTIEEMLKKGDIGKDQEQKFDYDQRDWARFEAYIFKFREPGNMKKTIEGAVEYVMLGKLKNTSDSQKVEDKALKLIKISEPKEQIPKDKERQRRFLNGVKAEIIGMDIPEEHRTIIVE